jgi:hypothetical protein
MSDKGMGMILATAIAAPALILCCGGGIALVGSALAGLTGFLSGSGILVSALIAVAVGPLLLAVRSLQRARRIPDLGFQARR